MPLRHQPWTFKRVRGGVIVTTGLIVCVAHLLTWMRPSLASPYLVATLFVLLCLSAAAMLLLKADPPRNGGAIAGASGRVRRL